MTVRILRGDVRDRLKELPDESVHCVVTSPPYWGLRDYGHQGQIGLEESPGEFVDELVAVFREVRRVLRADGTAWVNLGDSYAAAAGGGQGKNSAFNTREACTNGTRVKTRTSIVGSLKPKDLVGIPWRVALALQSDGWYLRQDIIWHKPNPMPESVRDRCTKAHEYIFLLSKSERYYYDQDAILEPVALGTVERLSQPTLETQAGSDRVPGKTNGPMKAVSRSGNKERKPASARGVPVDTNGETNGAVAGSVPWEGSERNKRSVWTVTTQPFKEAHFATFPPALIEPCILAGSPAMCCSGCGAPWARTVEREFHHQSDVSTDKGVRGHDGQKPMDDSNGWQGFPRGTTTRRLMGFSPACECARPVVPGTVLDPFGGAGTTGLVADRLQRDAILIELNPEYADMAERRIRGDAPLFAQVGNG
jgi:DNA modification methylase